MDIALTATQQVGQLLPGLREDIRHQFLLPALTSLAASLPTRDSAHTRPLVLALLAALSSLPELREPGELSCPV